MIRKDKRRLTLDRPATYQIKVSGEIDQRWSDWVGGMTIVIDSEGDNPPVTTVAGTFDQAALQGLLRQLYSLGLPLISVVWVKPSPSTTLPSASPRHPVRTSG